MNRFKYQILFFLIFAISGFSGLIYESIWTHYLKLFLGHAAYAQTLVLAIYMGGMAGGAWIAGKYSTRWTNLLLGYALVEGLIGFFALIFHSLYDGAVSASYDQVIPALGSVSLVLIYKWTLAAVLILPQSLLLGMTFPLMTAGFIRRFPESPGFSLSYLYFTNSLGAAIGVLASGFFLIQWVGLPGTILTAGLINMLVAALVWLLVRSRVVPGETQSIGLSDETREKGIGRHYGILLTAAIVTGTASFMYEIGWIRMLSLVLGSSTHSFELMLSAFILGLALGGFWIRNRIDRIGNPLWFLARVQILMGVLALSTLIFYGNVFRLMEWLLQILPKTGEGYTWFNLSSHVISLYIMLPTTFCAGMTLPLITYALLRQGHGEKSIGWVYSANTLGAILGICVAVHVGFQWLGLKLLIVLGAALDIGLGMILIQWAKPQNLRRSCLGWAGAGVVAVAMTVLFVNLDTHKMASGVFRFGKLYPPGEMEVMYHRDGKTASVDLIRFKNGTVALKTNGKSDAAIQMDPDGQLSGDQATMVMLGAVPLFLNPDAQTVGVVGLGSGLTTHTLLLSDRVKRVDTIEIEPAIVEASRGFLPHVRLAYSDPRSRIHIDDARTFFTTHNRKYDIIVSEPSNPWVSGVSSLFTAEFYRSMMRHLNEDGIFVQWIQLYEINMGLVSSIIRALSPHVSDYVIYSPQNFEMLLVAKKNGSLAPADPKVLDFPGMDELLGGLGIDNFDDFETHRIGDKKLLEPFFASYSISPNSDYFPILDLNAPQARFMQRNAQGLFKLTNSVVPALEMLTPGSQKYRVREVSEMAFWQKSQVIRSALSVREGLLHGQFSQDYPDALRTVQMLAIDIRSYLADCETSAEPDEILNSLFHVGIGLSSFLPKDELVPVWDVLRSAECKPFFPESWEQWISLFQAVGERDGKKMAGLAERILSIKENPDPHPLRQRYLLAVGMLGYLVQGNREGSLGLWSKYAEPVVGNQTLPVLFRFLLAHSEGRMIRAPSDLFLREDSFLDHWVGEPSNDPSVPIGQ